MTKVLLSPQESERSRFGVENSVIGRSKMSSTFTFSFWQSSGMELAALKLLLLGGCYQEYKKISYITDRALTLGKVGR